MKKGLMEGLHYGEGQTLVQLPLASLAPLFTHFTQVITTSL